MDRHEEVGLHLARLLNTHVKWHEIVGVPGEHDAHVRHLLDLRLQAASDRQHHVFFPTAAAADGAGVFAAMTRVECDRDQAVELRRGRGRLGARKIALQFTRKLPGHVPAAAGRGQRRTRRVGLWRRVDQRIGCFGPLVDHPVALADQRCNRVRLRDRIQVENQPVLVFSHRAQGEYLGLDLFFQIEHEAHHVRPVLADTHLADIRVVRLNLRHQTFQRRIEIDALDIDHQALRILDDEMRGLQVGIVFQGDAGVVLGRPDPDCQDLRRLCRKRRQDRQQQRAARLQGRAAQASARRQVSRRFFYRFGKNRSRSRHAIPRSESALNSTSRPVPAMPRCTAISGVCNTPAAFSGHSTIQIR